MELLVYGTVEVTLFPSDSVNCRVLGSLFGGRSNCRAAADSSPLFACANLSTYTRYPCSHDSLERISRRTWPHFAAGSSACSCRGRLDDHGHRGHHDGRPASEQRSSDRCGQPGRHFGQRALLLWRWAACRSRYTCFASFRSRQTRRLPSLTSARHLHQLGTGAPLDGSRVVL